MLLVLFWDKCQGVFIESFQSYNKIPRIWVRVGRHLHVNPWAAEVSVHAITIDVRVWCVQTPRQQCVYIWSSEGAQTSRLLAYTEVTFTLLCAGVITCPQHLCRGTHVIADMCGGKSRSCCTLCVLVGMQQPITIVYDLLLITSGGKK